MDELYTDLRVIRTKEAIRHALVELIDEKGFEAITVKDIASKARINRGTFYAHYVDKNDLMNKCQESILNGMRSIVTKKIPVALESFTMNKTPDFNAFTPAISIFEYLYDNRELMRALLGTRGDVTFQTKLKSLMWRILFEGNEISTFNKENLLVPGEYLVSYIASAHIGVIQQWLDSGSQESPQEMARILSTITLNGPFYAAGLKK
ncbi:TetR/AcrR family transcriptional regulator [Sporosarcina beigongshangi]|uniref:TetR/AcrR family transcriptional regulator n=1 Tax=Sporosarcina beigongshangi TaxID=2782538 RepID=UPI0019399A09|nr:TetR/AcrR family transcriptional regulator [Sporosarcina beigongshangi]